MEIEKAKIRIMYREIEKGDGTLCKTFAVNEVLWLEEEPPLLLAISHKIRSVFPQPTLTHLLVPFPSFRY